MLLLLWSRCPRRRLAILIATFLSCTGHGRRLRSSTEIFYSSHDLQIRKPPSSGASSETKHSVEQLHDKGKLKQLNLLARFFGAIDPAAAFSPFSPLGPASWLVGDSPVLIPSQCSLSTAHGCQHPVMKILQQTAIEPELDLLHILEEKQALHVRRNKQQASESPFRVEAEYDPSGDQPTAIKQLVERLRQGSKFQVLRGATGTGKTFVIAHTIAQLGKPALVLCHNKILAAQLVRELKGYLPSAAVELFVSYYNYYRPEAFLPAIDKYLQKQSSINSELDAMRHRATKALFERKDVVIVASVSCIYGIGLPKQYLEACFEVVRGEPYDLDKLVAGLKDTFYTEKALPSTKQANRTTVLGELERGTYMLCQHAEYTEVFAWPPYEVQPLCFVIANGYVVTILRVSRTALTASFDAAPDVDTELASSNPVMDALSDSTAAGTQADSEEDEDLDQILVYPARHHGTAKDRLEEVCNNIARECQERVEELRELGKDIEANRLLERVSRDLVLLRETGICPGVENYSRHLAGREPGEAPDTLLDYFALPESGGGDNSMPDMKDWLLIADESHVSLPQLKAMYRGDRNRKEILVRHGYRLPSALDNRPLRDPEFWQRVPQGIFVSATPGNYELDRSAETSVGAPAEFSGQELLSSGGNVVEMAIRPTYVLDPVVEVRSTQGQLQVLLEAIHKVASKGQRALVVAISCRDAEDLARWLSENGIKATYMHHGLTTPKRADVLRALQKGGLQAVVGVNLLREGLDLPEVSLVAIMNADKEGFLRNDRSLIQTIGRAARNIDGHAILFADRITPAMERCIRETARRRKLQHEFNEANGLSPKSTRGREVRSLFDITREQLGVDAIHDSVAWSRKSRDKSTDTRVGNTAVDNSTSDYSIIREANEERRSRVRPSPARFTKSLLREGESLDEVMPHVAGLRDMVASLPRSPGVYFWKAGPHEDDQVLYVGKAKNLRHRTSSYLRDKTLAEGSQRTFKMISKARHIDFELAESEHAALLLEARRIKELRPVYNVLLRDDTFYPYICVDHSVSPPDVRKAWRLSEHERGKRYYGPYTNARELQGILDNIEELFSLRTQRFEVLYGDGNRMAYEESVKDCEEILAGRGQEVAQHRSGSSAFSSRQQSAFNALQGKLGRRRELSFVGGDPAAPARDVAAVVMSTDLASTEPLRAAVQILQLRGDSVVNRFTYMEDLDGEEDINEGDVQEELLRRCLERHYMRCTPEQIPDVVITKPSLTRLSKRSLSDLLLHQRSHREPLARDSTVDSDGSPLTGKVTVREPRRSRSASALEERRAIDLAAANAEAELQRFLDTESQRLVALEDLQRMLQLERPPQRIEAYDISHLGGSQTVASRIVFRNGRPAKHLYRKYHIKSLKEGEIDDYKSMREVISRRFRAGMALASLTADEDDALPDIVLIDGGKGQLSVALEAIEKAGITPRNGDNSRSAHSSGGHLFLCSLAKREEDVFVPDSLYPLNLEKDGPALRLLMAARDESHRFANSFHRKRRSKKLLDPKFDIR